MSRSGPEVIVAGHLAVDPDRRDEYLTGCDPVITAARAATGCLDFHLSADRLEPGRINVFEHWRSAVDVERFRGDGTASQTDLPPILESHVDQHEISRSESL